VARTLTQQQQTAGEAYDVVIVGAGVAGALIGSRLAQAGARVVILEAGPRVDRDEAVDRYRGAIAKTPESPYPGTDWAPRPNTLDLDLYYVQSGPEKFKSTYERRVGGTTWHWLGTAIRLLPSDFEMKSRYGVGVDWPLSYAELEPWYGEAERELGVAGDSSQDLGSPRSTDYPMPPIPISFGDQLWVKAAATLGLAVTSTPQARNSVEYQGRPACCGNAMCIPICPIQAKYDASYHVKVAEDAGARVIENAVADRIEVNAEGKVTAVGYKTPDGAEQSIAGRIYVGAANAIETAKLLLMSTSEAAPHGVANSSDQVGRHLCDHPTQLSIAASKEPYYPYRGPLSVAGIPHFREGDFRRDRSAFRIEIGNDGWSWPGMDPLGVAQALIEQGYVGDALFLTIGERILSGATHQSDRAAPEPGQSDRARSREPGCDRHSTSQAGVPVRRVHDQGDSGGACHPRCALQRPRRHLQRACPGDPGRGASDGHPSHGIGPEHVGDRRRRADARPSESLPGRRRSLPHNWQREPDADHRRPGATDGGNDRGGSGRRQCISGRLTGGVGGSRAHYGRDGRTDNS
jgi:glucose dehydrogenase